MAREAEISINGLGNSIPLGELRWFMGQVDKLDDANTVHLSFSKGMDPRECDSWKLSASISTMPLPDFQQ